MCSCLPVILSPADELVERLILCLQSRNVSEDPILLNLFLAICFFCPPSNGILQQRRFFPHLRGNGKKKSWFLPSYWCWFLLFTFQWPSGMLFVMGTVVLSPVLSHALPWAKFHILSQGITSLFPRMILLSCLWLKMPWIFITGSAFQNCCCLKCFHLELFSLALQYVTEISCSRQKQTSGNISETWTWQWILYTNHNHGRSGNLASLLIHLWLPSGGPGLVVHVSWCGRRHHQHLFPLPFCWRKEQALLFHLTSSSEFGVG